MAKITPPRPQQSRADMAVKRHGLFTVNSSRDAIVTDENTEQQTEVRNTVFWIAAFLNTQSTLSRNREFKTAPGGQSENCYMKLNPWRGEVFRTNYR